MSNVIDVQVKNIDELRDDKPKEYNPDVILGLAPRKNDDYVVTNRVDGV